MCSKYSFIKCKQACVPSKTQGARKKNACLYIAFAYTVQEIYLSSNSNMQTTICLIITCTDLISAFAKECNLTMLEMWFLNSFLSLRVIFFFLFNLGKPASSLLFASARFRYCLCLLENVWDTRCTNRMLYWCPMELPPYWTLCALKVGWYSGGGWASDCREFSFNFFNRNSQQTSTIGDLPCTDILESNIVRMLDRKIYYYK